MATSLEPRTAQRYVDFDEYVGFQLEKTQTNIKWTDIFTATATVAAFMVGYVLMFTVLDHWVIASGFSETARLLLVLALVLVCGGWLVWKILRPYFHKVTALYAARSIEHSEPALQSTLLNLVDLKQSGREIPKSIRATLEKRAARALANMDIEQVIDRRPLMRASYILLGLIVLCCLYSVISPKSISFLRAFVPAAEVAPATRTEIINVRTDPPLTSPNETEVLARTHLEVIAELRGHDPERVTLHYTTADQKFVDKPVRMRKIDESFNRYRGILNGENGRGILQNLTYHVVAGDAVSSDYKVTVIQPPSAAVDEVRYEYPSYMELQNKTQLGGHIDAWEGTNVSLRATVNMPVHSAMILFSDTEDTSTKAEELRIKIVGGMKLRAEWTLKFRADGTYPHNFRIQCKTATGEIDPEPTLYHITIRPDRRPVVELLDPRGDLEVPANAVVPLLIEAYDPDFKLRYVTLRREKNGEVLPRSPQIFKGLQKQFKTIWDWHLKPMNLKAGDVITYWVEVRDNKEPLGNLSEKRLPLRLLIVDEVPEKEADRQLESERQRIKQRLEEDRQQENQQPPPGQPQQDAADDGNDGKTEQPDGKPETETGDESSSQKTSDDQGRDDNQPSEDGQQEGDTGSGEQRQQFDPDGKDDDEVTRKLLEKFEQQRRQQDDRQEDNQSPDEKTGDQQSKDGQDQQQSGDREPGADPNNQPDDGLQKSSSPENQDPKTESDQRSDGGQSPGNDADDLQQDSKQKSDGQTGGGAGSADENSKDDPQAGGGKGEAQGKPDAKQDSSAQSTPGGGSEKSDPGSADIQKADKPLDGQEQPAEDSDEARRQKASGDEKGPASADDDPSADPTQAKNKLDRKPGQKPTTRPHEGKSDPNNHDPQNRKSGAPGSTNPDKVDPAAQTKQDAKQSQNPEQRPSPPRENDPNRPAAKPRQQPETANEELKQKSPEGNSGDGKPSDQGNKESHKPGTSDSPAKPAGQEESDQPEGGQKGEGSGQGTGQKKDAKSKSSGKGSSKGSKGAGQAKGQSPQQSDEKGKQTGQSAGGAGNQSQSAGSGGTKGGPSAEQGTAGEGGSAGTAVAEKANLKYNKQAANLVLKKLEQDLKRGEVDQKLLDEFGWTEQDVKKYTERLRKHLNKTGRDRSPQAEVQQTQFQELLKGLKLRRGRNDRDRSTAGVAQRPRPVPTEYREDYEAYTRRLSKQGNKPKQKKQK